MALEIDNLGTGRPKRMGVERKYKQSSTTNLAVTQRRKLPRKAATAANHDEYEDSAEGDEDDMSSTEIDEESGTEDGTDVGLTTPRRKRKARSQGTGSPKKRRGTIATLTPRTKAALRQRAKTSKTEVGRPLRELAYESNANGLDENLPKDPWLRAMRVLHVGSRPGALPCRESEFNNTLQAVETLLEEGSSGCIYISGVPGTGKTATVHAMVRQLKQMAERNEINPFTYVEINGLRIPEPNAAYGLLWEAISGHDTAVDGHLRISAKEALKQLNTHFTKGVKTEPDRDACVVLMDELDQLMTTKQDVIYNFFNWPTLDSSKLIVIAVANTHDLPERVMSGRVRSRLGMVRTNFSPYTFGQLEEIVHARLRSTADKDGPKDVTTVISADGIRFAAKKVASISGDARRVLDICRRAVELVQPASRMATTSDVQVVIKRMQNSPTASFLQNCSLHERVMLAALLKCIRRQGTEDVQLADVQHQHLLNVNILLSDSDSSRKPTVTELNLVLDSLLASHAILIEDGSLTSKKAPGDRRVVLNVEPTEVQRVLGDLGGTRWKNVLSV